MCVCVCACAYVRVRVCDEYNAVPHLSILDVIFYILYDIDFVTWKGLIKSTSAIVATSSTEPRIVAVSTGQPVWGWYGESTDQRFAPSLLYNSATPFIIPAAVGEAEALSKVKSKTKYGADMCFGGVRIHMVGF